MDLKALNEPFRLDDIEWRIQSSGKGNNGIWAKVLAYIDSRAVQDRLDSVCGPENWQNEIKVTEIGGHSTVLCGISIRIENEWVTKWDGAEPTDVEPVKGGLSASMKRAAVLWGIGRYLYRLKDNWATIDQDGANWGKTKDGDQFKWDPPRLPDWALPSIQIDKPSNHNPIDTTKRPDPIAHETIDMGGLVTYQKALEKIVSLNPEYFHNDETSTGIDKLKSAMGPRVKELCKRQGINTNEKYYAELLKPEFQKFLERDMCEITQELMEKKFSEVL